MSLLLTCAMLCSALLYMTGGVEPAAHHRARRPRQGRLERHTGDTQNSTLLTSSSLLLWKSGTLELTHMDGHGCPLVAPSHRRFARPIRCHTIRPARRPARSRPGCGLSPCPPPRRLTAPSRRRRPRTRTRMRTPRHPLPPHQPHHRPKPTGDRQRRDTQADCVRSQLEGQRSRGSAKCPGTLGFPMRF